MTEELTDRLSPQSRTMTRRGNLAWLGMGGLVGVVTALGAKKLVDLGELWSNRRWYETGWKRPFPGTEYSVVSHLRSGEEAEELWGKATKQYDLDGDGKVEMIDVTPEGEVQVLVQHPAHEKYAHGDHYWLRSYQLAQVSGSNSEKMEARLLPNRNAPPHLIIRYTPDGSDPYVRLYMQEKVWREYQKEALKPPGIVV